MPKVEQVRVSIAGTSKKSSKVKVRPISLTYILTSANIPQHKRSHPKNLPKRMIMQQNDDAYGKDVIGGAVLVLE